MALLGGRYPGEMKRDGNFFGKYRDNSMFPELLAGGRHPHDHRARAPLLSQRCGRLRSGVRRLRARARAQVELHHRREHHQPRVRERSPRACSATRPTHRGASSRGFTSSIRTTSTRSIPTSSSSARRRAICTTVRSPSPIATSASFSTSSARQPWGERTAIIFSADHGEAFGEHSQWRHGFELWQPLVRVPWMFVLPGVAAEAHRREQEPSRSRADDPRADGRVARGNGGQEPGPRALSAATTPEPRDVIVDLPRTSDSDRRRAFSTTTTSSSPSATTATTRSSTSTPIPKRASRSTRPIAPSSTRWSPSTKRRKKRSKTSAPTPAAP